jgi:hypothetical protein
VSTGCATARGIWSSGRRLPRCSPRTWPARSDDHADDGAAGGQDGQSGHSSCSVLRGTPHPGVADIRELTRQKLQLSCRFHPSRGGIYN